MHPALLLFLVLFSGSGRIGRRSLATTGSPGSTIQSRFFYVTDSYSGTSSLVDTGPILGVLLLTLLDKQHPSHLTLQAVNDSCNARHREKSMTLGHTYRWIFLLADIPFCTLGHIYWPVSGERCICDIVLSSTLQHPSK